MGRTKETAGIGWGPGFVCRQKDVDDQGDKHEPRNSYRVNTKNTSVPECRCRKYPAGQAVPTEESCQYHSRMTCNSGQFQFK